MNKNIWSQRPPKHDEMETSHDIWSWVSLTSQQSSEQQLTAGDSDLKIIEKNKNTIKILDLEKLTYLAQDVYKN